MQETKLDAPIVVEPKLAVGEQASAAVIWLHGLGADGNDFAGLLPELDLPDNHGIRFIFPHAPVQPVTINGGMTMRSWYDIRSTDFMNDVDAAGIRVSCHHIYKLIEAEMAAGMPANKIVLAGFSQGGLIALHAGLSFGHTLAGIMALSTYCPMPQQFSQHREMPILMVHGRFDPVIPLAIAEESCTALKRRGYKIDWHEYPMEHQVCIDEINAIAGWLKSTLQLENE